MSILYMSAHQSTVGTLVTGGMYVPTPGCKESQFYSLPFRQAVASMY